jgi:hypothetical protein
MTYFYNRIKLEIDASDATNKITNHSGQTGATTGWTADTGYTLGVTTVAPTRASQTLQGAYTGGKTITISCTAGVNDDSRVYSPSITVIPGQNLGVVASFADSVVPSGNVQNQLVAGIQYYTSTGVLIGFANTVSFTTIPETTSPEWTMTVMQPDIWTGFNAVPANAATAKVVFGFRSYNNVTQAVTKPSHIAYLSKMMVVMTTSSFTSQGVQFSDTSQVFQSILGGSTSIHIVRGGDIDGVVDKIDVGTLTAVINDATLDPVKNPTRVKPGRIVRCLALRKDNVTWSTIFTGRLLQTNVDYINKKNPTALPRVTMTIVDAVNELNGTLSPFNYSGTTGQKVKALMASSTVPYVTDSGTASTTKTSVNENATLWDQLALVSNTYPTFKCWIDPNGTLQAKTMTSTTSLYTFTDGAGSGYVDIKVGASSRDVVNTLYVKKNNTLGEVTYGPYLNNASVIAYGSYQANVEVIDGTPSAIAQLYLNQFQAPNPIPEYVQLNYDKSPSNEAFLDLYSVVTVVNAQSTLNAKYYIISVEHEIEPDRWTTTYTFRPLDGGTAIVMSSPSAGADTGPNDVLDTSPAAGQYTAGNGLKLSGGAFSLAPTVTLTDEVSGSLFISDVCALPGSYWLSYNSHGYTDQPSDANFVYGPHFVQTFANHNGTEANNYLDGTPVQIMTRDSATSSASWIRSGDAPWVFMGGGGGTVAASAVTSTATGTVAATNVQAAIAELASEKQALPTVSTATATAGSVVAPTTAAVIPGAAVTVTVAATTDVYMVTATVDVTKTLATVTAAYTARLSVGGTEQASQIIWFPTGTTLTTFRETVTRTWYVTGLTTGSKVFQINHACSVASSYTVTASPHTTIQVVKLTT